MAENEQIGFDELPESKQYKSIDEAGVHRGLVLLEASYQPRDKKKKEKPEDADVFIGPWIKFVFQTEEPPRQFVYTMFSPPTTEEEVKFVGDVYENNVAIRKRTPKEQITQEFNQRFFFFEQLAKAWIVSPEKFASFKKSIKGVAETLFKDMFDKFFTAFPVEKNKDKKIDIKLVWNNNIKKHTSFLGLATPSASNLVVGPNIDNRESMLSISQYEAKLMKRAYSMHDRAPSGNATEAGGSITASANEWKAAETGTDGQPLEEDLF